MRSLPDQSAHGIAGIVMGLCNLLFSSSVLAIGMFRLGLATPALQTLAAVTLVFSGQAVSYAVRERRHIWSSRPGRRVILCSAIDLALIATLAMYGLVMAALPPIVVGGVLAAAFAFAFILDAV